MNPQKQKLNSKAYLEIQHTRSTTQDLKKLPKQHVKPHLRIIRQSGICNFSNIILCYLKRTFDHEILYSSSSNASLTTYCGRKIYKCFRNKIYIYRICVCFIRISNTMEPQEAEIRLLKNLSGRMFSSIFCTTRSTMDGPPHGWMLRKTSASPM